jgi:hypothetical protein
MADHEESRARLKLAWRIFRQRRLKDGRPVLLSEIAELRFLAETDEERAMTDEALAQAVTQRELRRLGIDPAAYGRGSQWP